MTKGFLVLVLCVASVNCGVLSGKALFCRDPDTGKLHAVNTTWTATSFCGNYTCSIRRRNITEDSSVPIREFNVTDIEELKVKANNETPIVTIVRKTESEILPLLHKNRMPDPKNMIQNVAKAISDNNSVGQTKSYDAHEKEKPKVHKCKMHREESSISEGTDRYLTEEEIDKIADMLHTIKKSDLEAIVDIYNLAQDIYKETDDLTQDQIKNEALNIIKEEERHRSKGHRPASYWYDPLASKGRLANTEEMDIQSSYDVYSTIKPMIQQASPSILNGAVSNNDIIEKVSYYPVTQFQRVSSYTHPTFKLNTPKYDEARNSNYNAQSYVAETNLPNSRKLIQPSLYLPYPFTNIHPYNTSNSRNFYYASPWVLDYYNKYKYYHPYYSAYIAPIRKAILINPQLSDEIANVDQTQVKQITEKEKEKATEKDLLDTLLNGQKAQTWKTEPIPIEVLKDIRADIDTSRLLKAFPLRKKVKLERVGKVINVNNLSNQVSRNKRFITEIADNNNSTDVGEFEAVLERVTCHDQTQPGYFRIGNLTQPYPDCCPQRIDTSR